MGAETAIDCLDCPGGFECLVAGTVSPTSCPTGKFCPEGITQATDCTAGNYCPAEAPAELMTPWGSNTKVTLKTAPDLCDAGKYCNNEQLSDGVPCELGYYCPEGSSFRLSCDEGSWTTITVPAASSTQSADCSQLNLNIYV